jgi:hypothetical protein
MGTPYETDVVAWAVEQAELLRSGNFSAIDVEHIVEEIEDVAGSERRELKHRLSVLIAHLLKWKFQPARRGASWSSTIRLQRVEIKYALKAMPSLRHCFDDEEWLAVMWHSARQLAQGDTGLDIPSPDAWSLEQVLDNDFWPD